MSKTPSEHFTDYTIDHLRVRTAIVPMPAPHKTAGGTIAESPLILIDVITHQGVVGHGLLFTYTRRALEATASLVKQIGELLHGKPLTPRTLEDTLARQFRLLGTQGLVGMALAGIDMALWDTAARIHNTSLVKLLGGEEKPIPAYGGIGYEGIKGSAKTAANWVDKGFTAVKAKIGYPTAGDDLAVVRAIREAVGDNIHIMVDYNQCLSPQAAIERIKQLEQENLFWIEEPTLAHDYSGHASITQRCQTPIQCGENWWGTQDMQHAIDASASSYMMLDVMKIGGVSGWLRAANIAQPKGIALSSHLWPEISAQLLSLTPTGHWLEYIDWWNPILASPLTLQEGQAITEGMLGTGICWNEDEVAKYTLSNCTSHP